MALRFKLSNSTLGSLIIERADPININDITQIVKRSEQYEGVFYEIILNVEFIKEGRAYLLSAFDSDGIEAIVNVTLYDYDPNLRKWVHYFSGKVNFNNYSVDEDKVSVNIDAAGIENRILNLIETDVDLERGKSHDGKALPAPKIEDVLYHSKIIVRQTDIGPKDNSEHRFTSLLPFTIDNRNRYYTLDAISYVQIDTSEQPLNELNETFVTEPSIIEFEGQSPNGQGTNVDDWSSFGNASADEQQYITFLNTTSRKNQRNPVYQVKETGNLEVDIQIRAKAKVLANSTGNTTVDGMDTDIGKFEVIAWYEQRGENNTIKVIKEIGRWAMGTKVGNSRETAYETHKCRLELAPSEVSLEDRFYVYLTYRVYGKYKADYQPPLLGLNYETIDHDYYLRFDPDQTWIRLKSATFFEASTHKTMLLHEAVKRCCQYYTNVEDCFYSELLGRTDILDSKGEQMYTVDGKASLIGLTSGNKIRKRKAKNLIANLKDILDFLNATYCIGFGFEVMGNRKVFRIEERKHFYNKSLKVLSLGKVYNIQKKLINKLYWNQVEFGYSSKLDIEQFSGIDEFNTLRRSTIPITNTKNKLTITTKMHASGNEIEFLRRLGQSSKDSKLDDENFVTVLVRNGAGFKTKGGDGYVPSEFVNINFPETQYNLDIAPAKMLRNWAPYIASCLIRNRSKLLKFAYGEVNYKLISRKTNEETISEHADLNLSGIEPIFDPEEYSFSFRLTRDQMKILKANPYGYIEFEDKDGNVMEGFIHAEGGIEHDSNKGTAEFTLLKVNRTVLGLSSELPRTDLIGLEEFNPLLADYKLIEKGEPMDLGLRNLIQYIKF